MEITSKMATGFDSGSGCAMKMNSELRINNEYIKQQNQITQILKSE